MRAWEEFLAQQERELGQEVVQKWLRPLKIIRFDACNLYLEAKDSFKALWFEEHMRRKVQSGLFNNNRKQIKVHISVENQAKPEGKREKKPPTPSFATPTFKLFFDDLDPNATLDNFIVSQSNLLAHKLLVETCYEQTLPFNPIYLFGRPGTGKTHLLMAATHVLKEAGKSPIYVKADTFTEHVVNAIRGGEMQTFRKAYRNVDALLIDDIEVFSRKGATQEELFHTFNTLHVENKLIILSSISPPQELKLIEPRLVSRFEWGIVIPLHMPEKEKMQEILLQHAKRIDFPLDNKVIEFLMEKFGHQTKTLLRALEALVLRSHLNQGLGKAPTLPLSLKTAQSYLADLIQEEERQVLTPAKIISSVAEFYGIRMDDILSKSQARECVLPRQIAMHLCRYELKIPFMKIGDIFSRDHSTVMASVKQIQKSLEGNNYEIANSMKGVKKLLESN